ncbi:MAG: serine hydrolase [Acidobacteria bacterium]|jgi:D-alanyl-D-alanine endopeptidase (penicillin-binding protein 7)|nr:serine hydrolase [Acidobacteriota bacterium]
MRLRSFSTAILAFAAMAVAFNPPLHRMEIKQSPPAPASAPAPSPVPSLNPARLAIRSSYALVWDAAQKRELYSKGADTVTPIASITKLMTAMVVLDAEQPLGEPIKIEQEDVDTLRNSLSRLPVGWVLTRGDLLQLALMSSENRAAHALARMYPGGKEACVAAMNRKAAAIGLAHTRFADSSGLNAQNVSTARDLARMVEEAGRYSIIRAITTTAQYEVRAISPPRSRLFGNSNGLVRNPEWPITLSKTGYISDSGFCLVMEAQLASRPVIMVFLDAAGKESRFGDANRVRAWLEPAFSLAQNHKAQGHPPA